MNITNPVAPVRIAQAFQMTKCSVDPVLVDDDDELVHATSTTTTTTTIALLLLLLLLQLQKLQPQHLQLQHEMSAPKIATDSFCLCYKYNC